MGYREMGERGGVEESRVKSRESGRRERIIGGPEEGTRAERKKKVGKLSTHKMTGKQKII